MQVYTASSTNAIAREAGVSPGTLYQFFPNKEAIAIELGGQLIKQMEEAHGSVFTPENARLPLDRLIDAVTEPFIAFNSANPAFLALIKGPDAPGKVAEDHDVLHASLLERITEMLAVRTPSLSLTERSLIAQMAFATFKAGLDLVVQHEGDERESYVRELKSMLYRYLAPCIGTEAVPRGGVGAPEKAADVADDGKTAGAPADSHAGAGPSKQTTGR